MLDSRRTKEGMKMASNEDYRTDESPDDERCTSELITTLSEDFRKCQQLIIHDIEQALGVAAPLHVSCARDLVRVYDLVAGDEGHPHGLLRIVEILRRSLGIRILVEELRVLAGN